ncbi:hypothetical protein HDG38_003974 [Paraburkholderia sp. WSM4177]|nr:hypothetical protein [Paraburkholderia sp. WSM4177]MBB5485893.1 hypothetical protein [Paraburkholderia sp. WSM4180]
MASPANPLHHPGAGAPPSTFEEATYRKVTWRLAPLLMLCYIVAYLDRVNVGFAKLGMSMDLGLSDAVYGFGAGIFFLGYFIFEVTKNNAYISTLDKLTPTDPDPSSVTGDGRLTALLCPEA